MIRQCALVLLVPSAACARPETPPGGPEDRVPPVVIETIPDTFAVVEPGVREFFFRFNERISERPSNGQLNNAVVISPSLGAARVRHGRDGITVEAQEGLEADRLYRVTVLPVINDMFSNTLRDPFDLVLSTGEEFVPNVVAGMVEDRVTGEAVPDARVEARFGGEGDTLTHWNLSDSDGVFSMRYVPGEPFQVLAWEDRDRDGSVGDFEPQSALSAGAFEGLPDTTFTILTLIQPDTTPARLARVEVQDSVTLNFEFDDYLEPDMPGAVFTGRIVLARLTDSASVAAAGDGAVAAAPDDTVAIEEPEDSAVAAPEDSAVAAPEDSAAAVAAEDTVALAAAEDTVAAQEPTPPETAAEPGDTAAAAGDSLGVEPGDSVQVEFADTVTVPPGRDTIVIRFYHDHEYERRTREVADSIARAGEQARTDSLAQLGELPPPAEEAEQPDTAETPLAPVGLSGQFLPTQTLTGVLEEALVRGVPYEASVFGVLNIAGVPDGGGTAVVVWELPPPDTATADSTAVAEDSLALGDSLLVGDSLLAGDSLLVPDTVGAGPDTTQAGPDTTQAGVDTAQAGPDTSGAGVDTTRAGPDTTRAGPDTTQVGPGTTRPPPPFVRSSRPRTIIPPRDRFRRRPVPDAPARER